MSESAVGASVAATLQNSGKPCSGALGREPTGVGGENDSETISAVVILASGSDQLASFSQAAFDALLWEGAGPALAAKPTKLVPNTAAAMLIGVHEKKALALNCDLSFIEVHPV